MKERMIDDDDDDESDNKWMGTDNNEDEMTMRMMMNQSAVCLLCIAVALTFSPPWNGVQPMKKRFLFEIFTLIFEIPKFFSLL